MSRDLLAALWPASFKGVPFFVQSDDFEFGRRIAIHEFYRRDDPFIQDLGGAARHYDVTIYIVGDDYDETAASLVSAMSTEGAGNLVLPIDGSLQARLEKCKRARELDRTGYLAFHAHFVKEGANSPLFSATYFAQMAFLAVDALGAASSSLLSGLSVIAQPSWIISDTASHVQDAVATIDLIRSSSNIDPTKSLALGNANAAFFKAVPAALDQGTGAAPTLAPQLCALAVNVADAMVPADAVAAFSEAFDQVTDPAPVDLSRSVNTRIAAANAQAIADAHRFAMLSAYAEALIRVTYENRSQGQSARAECVQRFDIALAASGGADQIDLLVALQNLRAAVVDYLSRLIIDLVPVVTVTTNVSLPSTVIAYQLYGDPTRALDLVARNDVRHPSFMPLQFEALAPSAATLLPRAA